MAPHISSRVPRIISNPRFWLVVVMFAIGIVLHYPQQILGTDSPSLFSFLGLARHAVERVFFLLPVTYVGFIFGIKAGLASLAVALVIMLPRVFLISPSLPDALLETSGVIVIGGLVNLWFEGYRREKERRQQVLLRLEAAQEELRETRDYLGNLLQYANAPIIVWDRNQRITIFNTAFEQLTGYIAEEVVGQPLSMLFPEASQDESLTKIRQTLSGEYWESVEIPILRKDGESRIALWNSANIYDKDGKTLLATIAQGQDITERKSAEKNLRYYLQEITRAQEEERRRIARELHDDTAQDLVVLSRQMDSFVVSAIDHLSTEDISYVERLRQQTERILDGVHRFSQDLRPSVLDDLGLLPALEWLTSDLTNHFEVAIALEVRGSEHRFSPEIELILFRIAQEALRNMWKHSEASKAWVTVEFGDDKSVLTVKDNGKGFELPARIEDLAVAGKLGLAGMQERVQLIGGRLTLQSGLGKGTTVTVEVPV